MPAKVQQVKKASTAQPVDLQEPLRMASSDTQLLEPALHAALPTKAKTRRRA